MFLLYGSSLKHVLLMLVHCYCGIQLYIMKLVGFMFEVAINLYAICELTNNFIELLYIIIPIFDILTRPLSYHLIIFSCSQNFGLITHSCYMVQTNAHNQSSLISSALKLAVKSLQQLLIACQKISYCIVEAA